MGPHPYPLLGISRFGKGLISHPTWEPGEVVIAPASRRRRRRRRFRSFTFGFAAAARWPCLGWGAKRSLKPKNSKNQFTKNRFTKNQLTKNQFTKR